MNQQITPFVFSFSRLPFRWAKCLLLFLFLCAAWAVQARTITPSMPGDTTISATICANETYPFNGLLLNLPGEYSDTLTASDGSDSTVTLLLNVLPLSSSDIEAVICRGESYDFLGVVLEESGTYEAVLTGQNGCDSILTLHLTVLPFSITNLSAGICSGTSYVFNGDTLTESGTYLAVLNGSNGCDSLVELKLNVVDFFDIQLNASICQGETFLFGDSLLTEAGIYVDSLTAVGGCDSIVTLELRLLPLLTAEYTVTICTGGQYVFQGDTLTTEGEYVYAETGSNGCDSVTTLILKLTDSYETPLEATICAGESYSFGGADLTLAGVYTDTLTAVGGCDSVLVLTLHVLPNSGSTITATICDGEAYLYGGVALSEPGDYIFEFIAENGCDSLVTVQLTVLEIPNTVLEAVICAGETFSFYGEPLNESGVYEQIFEAVNGCDSIITLLLTVLPELTTDLSVRICAGEIYTYQGDTLTQSGNYTFVLLSEFGCDSTVNLQLTVLPETTTTINASICAGDTYAFDGNELTDAGVYTAGYTGVNGCDSTVTLNLSVLPLSESAVEATICAGSTYLFNGISLTDAGVYTSTLGGANGCDSVVTLTLNVLPTFTTNLEATICEGDGYSFFGQILSEAGTYEFNLTAQNGCDSVIVIQISVIPLTYSALEASICEGETYTYAGEALTETGTYSFAFDGSNGCDSIVLVYLSVYPTYTNTLNVSLCAGESYTFNGQNLTDAGVYTAVYSSAQGCDSTIVLNLDFVTNFETNLEVSICAGESYVFDNDTLLESGVYTANYLSNGGCDSTVNLTLTVLPLSNTALSATICTGETFAFNGQELLDPGTYSATLTGANGCDSTIVLTLTVLPVQTTTLSAVICDNELYPFGGALLDESGQYSLVLQGANGCDSTVVLNLTVLPTSITNESVSICAGEQYQFNGQVLDASGIYTATLTNIAGCDSLVVLSLTVLPAVLTNLEVNTCEGAPYEYHGSTLTQSGVYNFVFNGGAANGCDSIVVLNLTVNDPILPIIVDAYICEGDTILFEGAALTEAGEYTFTYSSAAGCDSTIILGLAVVPKAVLDLQVDICSGASYEYNGEVLTVPGVYTYVFNGTAGCDSTVVLTLTVDPGPDVAVTLQNGTLTVDPNAQSFQWINCANGQEISGATGNTFTPVVSGLYAVIVTNANGCTAISDCYNVTVVGAQQPTLMPDDWKLFPNPATTAATIQFRDALSKALYLDVTDVAGRLLFQQRLESGLEQLRLDLAAYPEGLLIVRLVDEQGAVSKVLVKTKE